MTSPATSRAAAAAIARTHREEWARIVAGLARRFRDLDIAEDMASEAFAAAAEHWSRDGVPPNPAAWITTTAQRKALDLIRREARRGEKQREAFEMHERDQPSPQGVIDDDRLRLLFTCCHPALPLESRVALTLRAVGGLTVSEIARAFLVRDTTMGQRISRAKARIRAGGIPYRLPEADDLPARIDGVLAVLYLVFNEGYLSSGGGDPMRPDLTAEAIRLARLTHELLPTDPEVAGLLATMLFAEARAGARIADDGRLVRLPDQDRELWDRTLLDEGEGVLRVAFDDLERAHAAPRRYLLTAAINGVHARAAHPDETDWHRIVALYDRLAEIDPGPIVALNRAIAIAQAVSAEAALAVVEPLAAPLQNHHAYHATRAELLRAAGRDAEAVTAYDRAISLVANPAECLHLTRRREELASSPEAPHAGRETRRESR